MATSQQQCLDQLVLQRLLFEQLRGEEEFKVLAHIESCEACRTLLGDLAGDSQIAPDIREHLADHSIDAVDGATVLEGESEATDIEQIKALLGPTDEPCMLGRIGHYEINAIVGRGSAGVVFKALDKRLNRLVAIKMLVPSYAGSGPARQRFEREACAIAAVRDAHVIPVFAVDEHQGLPFIVMEYIPGGSLAQRIENTGALDNCEVVRLGMQIARGLQAAHNQGIVHRDVKPANVMLEGGVDRALVTDFGLARILDEGSMTRSGAISGTPQFMSPEQASGERVDHRSDLFSLGSVMYMACTGHSAFRSETVFGVIKRVCETEPRPIRETNPNIPEWLCDFISKLQSKNPDQRFQSAQQVADLLSTELAHLQSPTSMPLPERDWRPASAVTGTPSTKLFWVIGSVVAMVAMGLVFNWSGFFPDTEDENANAVVASNSGENPVLPQVGSDEPTQEKKEAPIDAGLEALENGKYKQALALFKRSVKIGDHKGNAEYNVARAYALLNRKDEAFDWLNKSVKFGRHSPDHVRADNDLKSLRSDERFTNFIKRLSKAESINQRINKAMGYSSSGEYEEAHELLEAVLAEAPKNEKAILQYGLSLHRAGKLDEAIKWHRLAAASSDTAAYGNYNIASYHALKGNPDKAFEFLGKAVDAGIYPHDMHYDSDLDSIRDDSRYSEQILRIEARLRGNWRDDEKSCFRLIEAIRGRDYEKLKALAGELDLDSSCPDYATVPRAMFFMPRLTPMKAAAAIGDVKALRILVDAGADVEKHYKRNGTPLMVAAKFGHVNAAGFLLQHGAKINHQVGGVGTPLTFAAESNELQMLKFLLSEGAEINGYSSVSGTALMAAARKNRPESVRLLLESGADINRSIDGEGTALCAATTAGHLDMMKMLISEGANVDVKTTGLGTALFFAIYGKQRKAFQLLLDEGADTDSAVDGIGTPLSIAITRGDIESIQELIKRKANVNRVARAVGTPMCVAASCGRIDEAKLLIAAGAAVNKADDGVLTPIAQATKNRHLKMVRFLLQHGADPGLASSGTDSANKIAKDRNHIEMLQVLKQGN